MATATNQPFRISTAMAKTLSDYEKYSDKQKYPYINFLPFTAPSIAAQKYDVEKEAAFQESPDSFDFQLSRKQSAIVDMTYPIQETANCKVIREKICGVPCEWVMYKGSDIKNGIILQLHGGAYVLSTNIKLFAQSELLSKLTGMVCLTVNYSKAPEYPIPTCVNEVVSIYKYLLNEKNMKASNLFMVGGSAGGGLILMTLQKLKKLNISQPCCVWMDAAWTDLSVDGLTARSKIGNLQTDTICGVWLNDCAEMAVGNLDADKKRINNLDLKLPQFSPLYGDFKGLCPMYMTVCATEILLDDTLIAAEKAYEQGVDVRVDISPFMLHCFAYKVNILPEAYAQTCIAAEWIMNQQRKYNLKNKL